MFLQIHYRVKIIVGYWGYIAMLSKVLTCLNILAFKINFHKHVLTNR